jgi:hypothetical protein
MQKLGNLRRLNVLCARMVLGTPKTKVFNRLRIQVNGVPTVPIRVQPIGKPKQNYAKTVSRHPAANRFTEK